MNINHTCYLKLTDKGKKALDKDRNLHYINALNNHWYCGPLHQVMNVFGQYTDIGEDTCFVDNELFFTKPIDA